MKLISIISLFQYWYYPVIAILLIITFIVYYYVFCFFSFRYISFNVMIELNLYEFIQFIYSLIKFHVSIHSMNPKMVFKLNLPLAAAIDAARDNTSNADSILSEKFYVVNNQKKFIQLKINFVFLFFFWMFSLLLALSLLVFFFSDFSLVLIKSIYFVFNTFFFLLFS